MKLVINDLCTCAARKDAELPTKCVKNRVLIYISNKCVVQVLLGDLKECNVVIGIAGLDQNTLIT